MLWNSSLGALAAFCSHSFLFQLRLVWSPAPHLSAVLLVGGVLAAAPVRYEVAQGVLHLSYHDGDLITYILE